MHINKKILFLILGLSLHGALRSMETEFERMRNNELNFADCREKIDEFTEQTVDDYKHLKNPEDLRFVGKFISAHREITPDPKAWKKKINHLTNSKDLCDCICPALTVRAITHQAIREVALNLEPGQDCSEELVKIVRRRICRKFMISSDLVARHK